MDSEEECLLDAGISQSLIPVTQMPTVTQDQEEEGLSEISTAISDPISVTSVEDEAADAAESCHPSIHHEVAEPVAEPVPSTPSTSTSIDSVAVPTLCSVDKQTVHPSCDVPTEVHRSSTLQQEASHVLHPAPIQGTESTSREAASTSKCIGPYLSAAGINQTSFQSEAFPTIEQLKNGHIVELFSYMTKTLHLTQRAVSERVVQISAHSEANSERVSAYVSKLIKEHKRIKTNHKGRQLLSSLAEFLDEEFLVVRCRKLKVPDTPKKRKLREDLVSARKEVKGVKRKLREKEEALTAIETSAQEKEALEEQLSKKEREHLSLTEENKNLQISYEETLMKLRKLTAAFDPTKDALEAYKKQFELLKRELQETEKKLLRANDKQGNADQRNLKKKIKRRDVTVEKLQQENTKMQRTITELQEEIAMTAAQLSASNTALDEVKEKYATSSKKKRNTYKKLWSSKQRKGGREKEDTNDDDRDALEERISYLETKNKELQQLVCLMEDPEIETFEEGKYKDSIRLTIMELLANNVSLTKVDKVIRTVLRNLAGKEVTRLPSMGTKSRILVEARHLADVEVATAISACRPEDAVGNCIHGDGTTKFHRKYQNFQVTLPDGSSRTMGLTEMAAGDTSAVFDSFTERVEELAQSIATTQQPSEDLNKHIISTIKSTMTDQGPTMPQFSEKVRTLKDELLPHVVSNWEVLTEEDRATCQQFATFYCKMHPIINFAEEVDKLLKAYEDIAGGGKSVHILQTSESGARRLVRTASKAFHHRGCDKSGVEDSFTAYITHQFNTSNHLVDYIGNRANILFEGASATYFHLDHISMFVSMLPDPNNLLKAVAEDAQDKLVAAELRALGITHKVVTEPLWTAVKTAPNVLTLNSTLHELQQKLSEWKEDATPMLEGLSAIANVPPVADVLYNRLFEDDPDPEKHAMCIQALELITCGILQILERQCRDHLPGGKFWEPDESTKTAFENVPSTNMIGERDFAILDMLVRQKPSARVASLEALIMWTNNKTSSWLQNLPEQKRAELMNDARSRAPALLKKFKERMTNLKKEKWQLLQEKQSKKQAKEQRQVSEKAGLVEGVMKQGGIWKSREQIQEEVEKMADEEDETVRRAIFQQLNFHQKVLQIKPSRREMFQLTTTIEGKKIVFSKEEMMNHLIEIVEANTLESNDPHTLQQEARNERPTSTRTFTEAAERNTKFKEMKVKLFQKMAEEKKKRALKHSKDLLEPLLKNPDLLVGKTIEHKCWNEEKTEALWYKGIVTKISELNFNVLRTEFSVRYEGDDEEWEFDLLNDLKKNDLIIRDM